MSSTKVFSVENDRSSARTVSRGPAVLARTRRLSTSPEPLDFQRVSDAHRCYLTRLLQAGSVTPDPMGRGSARTRGWCDVC